MNTDNSEAMRLADRISPETDWYEFDQVTWCNEAAALLRQQAERIAELEGELRQMTNNAGDLAVHSQEVEAERDQLRAELALRPWRPISPARIAALWAEACKPERPTPVMAEAFVRLVEADHGIDHARTTHKDEG